MIVFCVAFRDFPFLVLFDDGSFAVLQAVNLLVVIAKESRIGKLRTEQTSLSSLPKVY